MDKSLAGSAGKPSRMRIEHGKIREFARAIRSRNPAYFDEDRPLSPPTFLTTVVLWQTAENSPWGATRPNFARMLHGEQEFVFHGPPPAAGTVLTATTRIARVYDKEGQRGGAMTFAELVTEFRDETGNLAAESMGLLIELTGPHDESLAARRPSTTDEPAVSTAEMQFTDKPLTRTDMVRYQGASGDMNPIHHDEEFARKAGFPGVFLAGMLPAGILGGHAAGWLGAANIRRFKIRFLEQTWPGDVITYSGRIVGKRIEDGQQVTDLALTATRQTGSTTVSGRATFVDTTTP